MIAATDIAYQSFTLANGLRVIVHTDRRTPVVAVNVWYNVGSKNEPAGKTGFAHLFEHLMFNGSENVPGDFFEPLKQMGATDYNGTTYFDRTNYFETVPTDALARALYLESDRMGWLTGAITQNVLDVQRGVVQNEKRQGDNQPYGLVQYHQVANLLPAGHPYAHTPIGSMKDLDTATLADVKGWFHDHYGPNNAVLVLAGDVDVATARPLVEKYFGSIARGPETTAPVAPVTPLTHPIAETISDRVAMVMIDRSWTVPGLNDKDSTALDVAAGVLGGLASSRLDNIMVRQEKLAVSVSASNSSLAQIGTFTIHIMVRPGVNPAQVTARLDEIMRDFLSKGPTAAEVERVKTRQTVDTVESFESLNDKAQALAEGQLFSGDPAHYRKQLADLAAQTPEDVRKVAARWLSLPAYTLTVQPGAREAYAEATITPHAPAKDAAPPVPGTRGPLPTIGQAADLHVPPSSARVCPTGSR
jgi:predicted Zn-dependent peptidase